MHLIFNAIKLGNAQVVKLRLNFLYCPKSDTCVAPALENDSFKNLLMFSQVCYEYIVSIYSLYIAIDVQTMSSTFIGVLV